MRNFKHVIYLCVGLMCFSVLTFEAPAANAQAPVKSAPAQSSAPAPAKKAPAAKPADTPITKPTNEPFSIEQVLSFSFPETTSLITAPKGDRVAWVSNTMGRRNVWGAEAPDWNAKQITHYSADDGQEITDLDFSSDGALIAYVRGGDKNREGELPDPASDPAGVDQSVWLVAWAGTAPHKVDAGNSPHISTHSTATSGWVAYEKEGKVWIAAIGGAAKPTEVYMRGENGGIEWAPDGRKFAFTTNRASHSLVAIYDATKKEISYITPTTDSDSTPRWSPDGHFIAFMRSAGGFGRGGGAGRGAGRGNGGGRGAGVGPEISVFDVATNQVRSVYQTRGGTGSLAVQHDVLNWGADGRLVFVSEIDGWQHLYSVPMSGGTADLLTPGECEYETMSFTADRKNILFNSNCGDIDRRHLWQVSVAGGAPVAVTTGEAIEWMPVTTASGKWVAYFSSDAQHPATPFARAWSVSQPSSGKAHAMMPLPKDFPTDKLVTPTQVIVPSGDGFEIHCQLFLPKDLKPGEKRPTIIFMHGGPSREMLLGWHYMYYYSNSYGMNQYLVSHGYIVLSINYRGGIGYGRAFRTAPSRGGQGASEYQDILAGANFLRSRDDVDITRLGLWGGSYGGYLTAMGLARNSDIFAAGVDFHGVHDWSQQLANNALPPGVGPQTAQAQPNTPASILARESSPVASVSTWKSPVLLMQGDDDRNVYFGQMIELVPMLRQQGVDFEQIVFPDEVHDFLLWHSWNHAYHAELDFFERKLKNGGLTSTRPY